MNLLFTFKNFADVFLCKKIVNAAGLSCRVIPVPRSLGVTCEYAAEVQNIDKSDVYSILELLKKDGLLYTRVFHSTLTPDGEIY
ncbi:MAG: DUF3343 domain-containing protein [Treponema sp.]|jgi:hypothetical protein|nr:DUF3343 domain-containing protein [Treponema sp.]